MGSACIKMLSIALLAPAAPAETKDAWSFELFLGSAYNAPMPLSVRQDGQPDINLTVEYETLPFTGSPYYSWRIGRWRDGRAWELELIHHKVRLPRNENPDIQWFEISHGYNLITINRAWPYRGFVLRLGGGMVVGHPETEVRTQVFPDDGGLFGLGFYVLGPTVQATAGRRFRFWKGLYGTLEAKFTMSYAWVPIQDGSADAPVIALHGLFGLGYEF